MSSWIDYKHGDYEKKFYDIKLHDGSIFLGCWPNAGMFNAHDYGYFDESVVAQVRPSKLNNLGMPERMGLNDAKQAN